jgi:hypothetical protein
MGGIAFPSADIYLMIIRDIRFSGILIYISLIPIGITISSPAGIYIYPCPFLIYIIYPSSSLYISSFEYWAIFEFELIAKGFLGIYINSVACNRLRLDHMKLWGSL